MSLSHQQKKKQKHFGKLNSICQLVFFLLSMGNFTDKR